MEKISVIIPTYNRSNTLLRAVNSALSQTYPAHEVLVCDDGSTDNSRSLVEGLNNRKVKWIDCGRNGMPSIPRNKGIQAATGTWIAFLDSDDEWLPGKIELQMRAIAETKTDACSTNAFRIVNNIKQGAYLNLEKKTLALIDLLPINYIICSSVLVKKEFLIRTSLFPEEKNYKAIEDYALWLRLATKTSFAYVNEPLVDYHDDPASSVRTNYTDVWDLRQVIFSGFTQWLKEKNIALQTPEQKKLEQCLSEIANKGKTTLWQKIKNKIS